MKKLVFLAFVFVLGNVLATHAQEEKVGAYFTTSEMPDLLKILAPPPSSNSAQFSYDIMRYFWGKEQRLNPERAAIAIRDAEYGIQTIINEFSVPFGMQISETATPNIYKLLQVSLATVDSICTNPKKHYMRVRPFVFFNEPTLVPKHDKALAQNGSYPSGHAILGYSAALLLSEINPARADTLISRGLMYGESRVIVGAHWQSDVDAGVVSASIAYMKLHTSDHFLRDMDLARKEFARCVTKASRR